MAYYVNLFLRPSENIGAPHSNEKVITLTLRSEAELNKVLPGDLPKIAPQTVLAELNFPPQDKGHSKTLPDLLQDTAFKKLPIIGIEQKTVLWPDEKAENAKAVEVSGFAIKPGEPLLHDKIAGYKNKRNDLNVVAIALTERGTAQKKEGDFFVEDRGQFVTLMRTVDDTLKEKLIGNDVNYLIKISYDVNGEVYADHLLITVTVPCRTWYCALDFGSESTQYQLINSYSGQRFPTDEKGAYNFTLIETLKDLLHDDGSAFLQIDPANKMLYNSIFPVLRGQDLGLFGDYKFQPFRQPKDEEYFIKFLSSDQEGLGNRFLLPNLKVLEQLIVLRHQTPNPDLVNDINKLLTDLARMLELKNKAGAPNPSAFTTFRRVHYREILLTFLSSIINIAANMEFTEDDKLNGNYNRPTFNLMIRVLFPNMFQAADVKEYLQWINHDLYSIKEDIKTFLQKVGLPTEGVDCLNSVELMFMPEGDAACFGVYEYAQESNKKIAKKLLVVDIGKGTTDISMIEANAINKPTAVYRTGFAGAGNYLTYHFFIAFCIDLLEFVGVSTEGVTTLQDCLNQYNNPTEKLPEWWDPMSGEWHLNEQKKSKQWKEEDRKSPDAKKINKQMLELICLKIPADPGLNMMGLYGLFDHLKKEQESLVEGEEVYQIQDIILHLGWYPFTGEEKIVNMENIFARYMGSFGPKALVKDMREKNIKFSFTSKKAKAYLAGCYGHITNEVVATLKQITKQQGLGGDAFTVIFTGRGSLDATLVNNIKKEFGSNLDYKDINQWTNTPGAHKIVAVVGAGKKGITLNFGSTLNGLIFRLPKKSRTVWQKIRGGAKDVFKDVDDDPKREYDIVNWQPASEVKTNTRAFYAKRIMDFADKKESDKKMMLNGYECYYSDNASDPNTQKEFEPKGQLFFTNAGYKLYYNYYIDNGADDDKKVTKYKTSEIKMDFSKPVGIADDEERGLKTELLYKMARESIFPYCNAEDVANAILEGLRDKAK